MSAMDKHSAEDPKFAVICSFLDNFQHLITDNSDTVTIDDIQQFLDATEFEQTSPVVKLHLKLLRGIGFSPTSKPSCTQFSKDMIKFIEDFPERDDKLLGDLEYNYTLLPAEVKIRILKNLLEDQFQFNDSFNEKVNNDLEKRGDIRHTPAGRDKLGRTYWFMLESTGSMLLYRQLLNELTGEETWALVCRDIEGLESLIDSLQSDEVALENADPMLPSNTTPVMSSVVNMATETGSRQKMAGLGFQPMCSPLFFKAPPLRDIHEILEDERLYGLKHCSVHLKKIHSNNEQHRRKLSSFDEYGSNRSKGKPSCADVKEIKSDTCISDFTKSSGMKYDDIVKHKCPDLKPGLKDMKPVPENSSTNNDHNYCGKPVSDLVVKVCALSNIANDDVKVKVGTNKNVKACIPSKHSVTDESVKGSVVTMLEDIKKVTDEINFATDKSGKEVTTKIFIDNNSTVNEANMAITDVHIDKNKRCSAGKTDKIDKNVNGQLKACTDKIDISDDEQLKACTDKIDISDDEQLKACTDKIDISDDEQLKACTDKIDISDDEQLKACTDKIDISDDEQLKACIDKIDKSDNGQLKACTDKIDKSVNEQFKACRDKIDDNEKLKADAKIDKSDNEQLKACTAKIDKSDNEQLKACRDKIDISDDEQFKACTDKIDKSDNEQLKVCTDKIDKSVNEQLKACTNKIDNNEKLKADTKIDKSDNEHLKDDTNSAGSNKTTSVAPDDWFCNTCYKVKVRKDLKDCSTTDACYPCAAKIIADNRNKYPYIGIGPISVKKKKSKCAYCIGIKKYQTHNVVFPSVKTSEKLSTSLVCKCGEKSMTVNSVSHIMSTSSSATDNHVPILSNPGTSIPIFSNIGNSIPILRNMQNPTPILSSMLNSVPIHSNMQNSFPNFCSMGNSSEGSPSLLISDVCTTTWSDAETKCSPCEDDKFSVTSTTPLATVNKKLEKSADSELPDLYERNLSYAVKTEGNIQTGVVMESSSEALISETASKAEQIAAPMDTLVPEEIKWYQHSGMNTSDNIPMPILHQFFERLGKQKRSIGHMPSKIISDHEDKSKTLLESSTKNIAKLALKSIGSKTVAPPHNFHAKNNRHKICSYKEVGKLKKNHDSIDNSNDKKTEKDVEYIVVDGEHIRIEKVSDESDSESDGPTIKTIRNSEEFTGDSDIAEIKDLCKSYSAKANKIDTTDFNVSGCFNEIPIQILAVENCSSVKGMANKTAHDSSKVQFQHQIIDLTEGFTCDTNHATTKHNSNSSIQPKISPADLKSIAKCSVQSKQALRGKLKMTAMPNTLGLSLGTASCSQFSEITIPQHVVEKRKDVKNRLVFVPSLSGKQFVYKLKTSATSSTTVILSSSSSLTPAISFSSSTPTVSSTSSTSIPFISSSFSSLTPVNKFQVKISSAVPRSTADMTVLNVGEKPEMCYMNKTLLHSAPKYRKTPVKALTSIQESIKDKLKEKISSPKNGLTLRVGKNDGKLLTLSSIKENIKDKQKRKISSPRNASILYAGSDGRYYVQSTGEVFDHPSLTQSIHHKAGLSFFVHESAIAIKKKSIDKSKPVQNVAHTPKCKVPARKRKKGGMKIHYEDTESSDSSFSSEISDSLSSEDEDDLDKDDTDSAM
ncbi:hypothetical protein DPMN_138748, partial [Dreissena polymorpha]